MQPEAKAVTSGLDWSEKASLAFVALAIVTLLGFGGVLSAIAFLLCAVMGWTRAMRENEAKGKPTLSGPGRLMVGAVLASVGVAMFPAGSDAKPEPEVAQAVEPTRPEVAPVKRVVSDAEAKRKLSALLEAERELDRENVEGRLYAWDDIVALAPDNAEFARKRAAVKGEVDALALYRDQPELGAEVVKIRPRKEGFGNVMVVDVTIRNRALSHLKDFVVVCDNSGASGTVINRTERILYEMVPARSTETFKNINLGLISQQVKSTNCRIDSATIA